MKELLRLEIKQRRKNNNKKKHLCKWIWLNRLCVCREQLVHFQTCWVKARSVIEVFKFKREKDQIELSSVTPWEVTTTFPICTFVCLCNVPLFIARVNAFASNKEKNSKSSIFLICFFFFSVVLVMFTYVQIYILSAMG